jgi:DNA-binding CsgD family transcriptional regulator
MARLAFIFILLFCFRASAQPTHLLKKTYAARYVYVDSLRRSYPTKNPDKTRINGVLTTAKWARQNKDQELTFLLELLECTIKAEDNAPGSLAGVESDLLKLSDQSNKLSKYLKANALQSLGDFYNFFRNKNNISFEYYLLAYNQYKSFTADEFPAKRLYLYGLAGAYFRYDDFPNAIKYMKDALATKNEMAGDNSITLYNTIGVGYQRLKKYDSALLYFNEAINEAKANNDTIWLGILGGNVGLNYYYQQNYAAALPLIKKDVEQSYQYGLKKNAMGSSTKLADIYLRDKKTDLAETILQNAQKLKGGRPFWPDYELAATLYYQLAKVYEAKGDMKLAFRYADSAFIAKDSGIIQKIATNQAKAEEKAELVQHKFAAEQIANEKRLQEFIRNSLIMFIFLLTIIGIMFINRQRLKRKKLEAEMKKAAAELNAATSKLVSFRQRVDEKDELIEQYSEQIDQLKKEDEDQEDSEVRAQLENAILLTDEQWEEFRRLFEKVHSGFFNNLKKKIPDLTPAEVRFLALTKLKLSPKEMSSMLGVSSNAIRLYKHRLRKKLNMDKDNMIEELVEKL